MPTFSQTRELLANDRQLLNKHILYELMNKIDPNMRIDGDAENILIEFVNEYTENLMEFAMDVDKGENPGDMGRVFDNVELLDMAKDIIERRGLKHAHHRMPFNKPSG